MKRILGLIVILVGCAESSDGTAVSVGIATLSAGADSGATGSSGSRGESTAGAGAGDSGADLPPPSSTGGGNDDTGGAVDTGAPTDSSGGVPDDFCPGGLIADRLMADSSGEVSGGTFVPDVGWQTSSAGDRIFWDLGQEIQSGSLSFEVTGIHANVGGCLLGVCYYVGIFDNPTGDKHADYNGDGFIESRFHTNDQRNFNDVFKLQAGVGDGDILEPQTPPMGWSPEETHAVRIEWGPDPSDPTRGRGFLYLDDAEAPLNYQAFYSTPNIPWRYLYLGSTRYQNLDWGMIGVTYKNLCVRAN